MLKTLYVCVLVFKYCAALRANIGSHNLIEILAEPDDDKTLGTTNLTTGPPPPHSQVAKMARYITHQSDWCALATTAARSPIQGFPFANIFSMSDGAPGQSTGVPYFYISKWEISAQDLAQDNKASITMSLAQGSYCSTQKYDPEDPRCAHSVLTGVFLPLQPGTNEEDTARTALFTRHPVMPDWPEGHHWFFAKLNITNILLLDFFGGAITVPVKEYFRATPN